MAAVVGEDAQQTGLFDTPVGIVDCSDGGLSHPLGTVQAMAIDTTAGAGMAAVIGEDAQQTGLFDTPVGIVDCSDGGLSHPLCTVQVMGIDAVDSAGTADAVGERAGQAGQFDRVNGVAVSHGVAPPGPAGPACKVREFAPVDRQHNGAGREGSVEAVQASAAGISGESIPTQSGGAAASAVASRVADGMAESVAAALDVLIESLRALGTDRLEERLGLVGVCENRMAAVKVETVAALARRDGEAKAADAVRTRTRQSRYGAKRDVKLAAQLAGVPKTAGALAEGSITPQHARLIAEAAEQASPAAPIDEAELLAAAEREPADVFGNTVRGHVNARIGDDLAERRRHQRSQRRLSIKQQPDGMFELFGRFDPVTGSRIETALAAKAGNLWRSEDPKNRPTTQQRMADALELLTTTSGGTGDGNVKSTAQGVDLLVKADYDTVAGRLRDARLIDGTPLTPEELVRLACDANILPALFNRKGEPLWLGRGKRHATAHQRAVLAERDKGCVGCGASANWCQAHHIVHWEHGGTTDLDNLCLLCSHCHHHEVHTNGASIVRRADGRLALQHRERPPPARNRNGSTTGGGCGGVRHPLRC